MILSNFQTSMNISYCLSLYYYTVLKFKIFKYKTKVAVFFDQSSSQLVHVWNLDGKSGSPADSKSKPGHLTGRVIIVQPPNTPSKNVPHKLAYPIPYAPNNSDMLSHNVATYYLFFTRNFHLMKCFFMCKYFSTHITENCFFFTYEIGLCGPLYTRKYLVLHFVICSSFISIVANWLYNIQPYIKPTISLKYFFNKTSL